MNHLNGHHPALLLNRYGMRLAARLNDGAENLPHDIAERLRAARVRSVAQRKRSRTAPALLNAGAGVLALGPEDEGLGWFTRISSVLPLVALVAGLLALQASLDDKTADELAEVDAAILVDDLPPAAYTDPGFAQFLKENGVRP
jgi:hypothetical protein